MTMNVENKTVEIWKRLDEKYGYPYKLADMVIIDVRKCRYIREGDVKAFVVFVETVERGYRDLEILEMEKEISNTGTVSFIEERLPRDIRREWSKKANEYGSTVNMRDKFPALVHFLQEQRKIIDYEFSEIRYGGNEGYKGRVYLIDREENCNQENETVLQMNSTVQRCLVHSESNTHTTPECFKGMDVKGRTEVVKQKQGCWSCLKTGHSSADCRFRKLCEKPNCRWYHHALLHENQAPLNRNQYKV